MQELNTNPSPVTKLQNWSIIKTELESCNVQINDDIKTLIIAGDHDSLIDLLQDLKAKLEMPNSEYKEEPKPQPGFLKKRQPKKSIPSRISKRYIYYRKWQKHE